MGAKPVVPPLLRAAIPFIGEVPDIDISPRSDGGRLSNTRCSKVPRGASGSSTRTATLLVSGGTAAHEIGGETLRPSQVYSLGMIPPSLNADDVTDNIPVSRALAVAHTSATPPANSHKRLMVHLHIPSTKGAS